MRAGLARFFDDRNRQRLASLGFLQLREPQRRRQARRTAADDENIDFESLTLHWFGAAEATPSLRGLSHPSFCHFSSSATSAGAISKMSPVNAVIGDLEDRRFGVLVDRDDRARALHSDQVLNRAGDPERDVQLRRDGLARAANLALHRQPAVVADRPRRRKLGAKGLRQLFGNRQVLLRLDPAPDGDDPLGLRQIDGLLRFLKRRLRLLSNRRRIDA